MDLRNKQRVSVYRICLVAMAVVMNAVGAQLALTLKLPVYLDSIGTGLRNAAQPHKRGDFRHDH